MLPSGTKNKLVTKHQFCTAQQQVENCASVSDRVCDYLIEQSRAVLMRERNKRTKYYYYETIALLYYSMTEAG